MADEAALALQPGCSPSAVAAEREAASPPTGEPLCKRPRRDGPGLGRSPGEPDGAAPECEMLAAARGGPAALWREAAAAAGGEREAQAAAGGGDNGPGLQGLSLELPPADDFDDDDDEGEEEGEAAAIGYRGAQGAGGWDCAFPPPSPGAPPGVGLRGLSQARASRLVPRRVCPYRGPRLCVSGAADLAAGGARRLARILRPFHPAARPGSLALCRWAGKLSQLVLK